VPQEMTRQSGKPRKEINMATKKTKTKKVKKPKVKKDKKTTKKVTKVEDWINEENEEITNLDVDVEEIEEENTFGLLLEDDNTEKGIKKGVANIKAAEKAIVTLIKNFNTGLKKIEKKYPDVGIGDTVTDEEITTVLYDHIHFGNNLWED